MKKLIFIVLIICNVYSFGQTLKTDFMDNIDINSNDFIGFDVIGTIYYLNQNVFYSKSGKQIFEYKNIDMGKPSRIDIQNPLKIVLFYENFNTIITLDNQLNELQKINLSDLETPINAVAIGISSNNNVWVYNTFDNKIGLFDYLKKTYKSISNPIITKLKYYQTNFNNFYFLDEDNNLFECTIFGQMNFLFKTPVFDKILIVNSNEIIYSYKNELFVFDVNKKIAQRIEIYEKSFENFSYKNQILTIFTNQKFSNYKINLE